MSDNSRYARTQKLLEKWLSVPDVQLGCDECDEHMARLAELLAADAVPIGVLAAVQQHIENCHCCSGEFQALLSILKMEQSDLT